MIGVNSYSIYGFTLQSEFPLPSLPVGNGIADVIIKRDYFIPPPMQSGMGGLRYHVDAEVIYLQWENVGMFRLRQGREILVAAHPHVSADVLQRFLLGSVLGCLLYQRGEFALHASAVAGPAGAIIFLGDAGWGKSTLAASFCERGYRMVADDIAIVRSGEWGSELQPGVPECKLWPDALVWLGEEAEDLPEVFPGQHKRVYSVGDVVQRTPIPLRRIYILAIGESHALLPLSPLDTALHFMRHTYGVTVLHASGAKRHFQHCTDLARVVPAHILQRPRSLAELPTTIALIEKDQLAESNAHA